jgi:hypothetical protein
VRARGFASWHSLIVVTRGEFGDGGAIFTFSEEFMVMWRHRDSARDRAPRKQHPDDGCAGTLRAAPATSCRQGRARGRERREVLTAPLAEADVIKAHLSERGNETLHRT